MSYIPVSWATFEEVRFGIHRIFERFFSVNILLTPVDDSNEAEFQWVYSPVKDIHGVRPSIHQVYLGQDADRPPTLGIDGAGELQGFRIGKVYISSGDGQDDTEGHVSAKLNYGTNWRTNLVLKCNLVPNCGFVVRCRWVGHPQESITQTV